MTNAGCGVLAALAFDGTGNAPTWLKHVIMCRWSTGPCTTPERPNKEIDVYLVLWTNADGVVAGNARTAL